ncbi:MAG TPA: hypothetical protein VE907_20360 [Gammaproteobacteria bacterium]|nr:hypothetical protein [Gammaproteobacteria bacterium]
MIAGKRAEHILLESADAEAELGRTGPGAVRQRLTLDNRVLRVRTELKLYENGYLGICERRAGRHEPERRLPLQHIDPRLSLSLRPANVALGATLGTAAAAAVLAALGYASVAPSTTLPAAAAASLLAVVAAALYLLRAQERVQLVTRHGRVAVVTLIANRGCMRACRALVPPLSAAIEAAVQRAEGDRTRQLRAEVREHYRLYEIGLLSSGDCMLGVQRVLAAY